jgi:hypothetical protein
MAHWLLKSAVPVDELVKWKHLMTKSIRCGMHPPVVHASNTKSTINATGVPVKKLHDECNTMKILNGCRLNLPAM